MADKPVWLAYVYVVTSGCYSDYHIEGIFTDEGLAQSVVTHLNHGDAYDEARIERFQLNPNEQELAAGLFRYGVQMMRDGNVQSLHSIFNKENFSPYHEVYKAYNGDLRLYSQVLARDKTHAIKIVNEKRAQLIAQERFREGEI